MEAKAREDAQTASGGQGVAARKEATRARILAAALREFGDAGFDGASMNGVGVRAGVANGTVFFHFKNKPLLYREVVRHAADAFYAAVSPLARTPGTSFLEVVDGQEAFLREHPDIAALLWSAWGVHAHPTGRVGAREVDARLVSVWRHWIATRRSGPSADGDGLARLVASAVAGLLATRYVDPRLEVGAALAQFGTFVETTAAAARSMSAQLAD